MAESTFTAGERATLDLRDCTGSVVLEDAEEGGEPTIGLASESDTPPFVLREGDTFRVRFAGGTITVPRGLPVEVQLPSSVQLRLKRAPDADTLVRPVATASAGTGNAAAPDEADDEEDIPDLGEFARRMSEHGRRIFRDMAEVMRNSGVPGGNDAGKRMDEASQRIDEYARKVAEKVQSEAERFREHAQRAEERARRHAERMHEHATQHADRAAQRAEEHARRHAERADRRAARAGGAGRGRWWFTERFDDWGPRPGAVPPGGRAPAATSEERTAILQMLQDGKITAEQAERLLSALGG